MTRDEALAKWTRCVQVREWNGNYAPEENDGGLARKLRPYADAAIEEVKVDDGALWPKGRYTAIVKVIHREAKPAQPRPYPAQPIPAVEEGAFYLAVG